MNNEENFDFFEKIDELYPEGLVNNLRPRKRLYVEAKARASLNNMTIKEFFEDKGYRYIYQDIKKVRKELKKEIDNYAVNNELNNLHLQNSTLYYKILRYANLEDMTIQEYFSFLGYKYNKAEEKQRIQEIKNKLKKHYPNKRVKRLSMVDNNLYSQVYKLARKENLSVMQYVRKLGFN